MNKKDLTIWILFLTCTAIILAGVLWCVEKGNREMERLGDVEVVIPEKGPKNIDILNGEDIDTSDWKTYRNEELGFEVKYPEDWILNEDLDNREVRFNGKENEKLHKMILQEKMYGEGYIEDVIITEYSTVAEETENKLNNLGATTVEELIERNEAIMLVENIRLGEEEAWVVIRGGMGTYLTILAEHDERMYQVLFGNKDEKKDLLKKDYAFIKSFFFIN